MTEVLRKSAIVVTAVALLWGTWNWLKPKPDDEAWLLALPSRVATLVEKKEPGEIKELVSKNYSDAKGRTQNDLHRAILSQMLHGGEISVYTLGPQVAIDAAATPPRAVLTFRAALARGPRQPGALDVFPESASIYLFTLELEKTDGKWLLVSGDWVRSDP
jgi:hypothetical protein